MVPLLITMDLEVAYDYDLNEQKTVLENLCIDFKKIGLPITIFATSESVDCFPEQIKMLHISNNEIACHGLNHCRNENYKNLLPEKIDANLLTAGKNIENLITEKPICFRGPGMSTSTVTQRILVENGYKADFSICPQRVDFFNSKGGDIRWIFAPRLPYNPSNKNPYTKGNIPLWVVPLSCIGVPFISGILYLFGLRFMKFFFNLLMKESIKTKKPIVYIFHSYEFAKYVGSENENIRTAGVKRNKRKLIHRFYAGDPLKRFEMNIKLIKYMLSFDSISPLTGKEYCEHLNREMK